MAANTASHSTCGIPTNPGAMSETACVRNQSITDSAAAARLSRATTCLRRSSGSQMCLLKGACHLSQNLHHCLLMLFFLPGQPSANQAMETDGLPPVAHLCVGLQKRQVALVVLPCYTHPESDGDKLAVYLRNDALVSTTPCPASCPVWCTSRNYRLPNNRSHLASFRCASVGR